MKSGSATPRDETGSLAAAETLSQGPSIRVRLRLRNFNLWALVGRTTGVSLERSVSDLGEGETCGNALTLTTDGRLSWFEKALGLSVTVVLIERVRCECNLTLHMAD